MKLWEQTISCCVVQFLSPTAPLLAASAPRTQDLVDEQQLAREHRAKLDDLALSLLDDFKSQHVQGGSHSLAALLAFGLVYAHELFHARVEAALSWHEVNTQQARHLRYKDRVYQALRETPEWLEEALANWSAFTSMYRCVT